MNLLLSGIVSLLKLEKKRVLIHSITEKNSYVAGIETRS